MSLPKAQLVDPQGNMNLPGMTATGIVTATSLSGIATGSATGLTGNPDLDVGIVTASSFVGEGDGHAANITGTPQLNLGVTTATSFVGDATGKAAGLTGTPNLNVGLITATGFVGFVTGNVVGSVTGNITGNITGNVTGNITGLAGSVASGANIHVGVMTATSYHGDGSALTGIAATNFNTQTVPGSTYSINVTSPAGGNYTLSGNDRNGTVSGSDPTVTVEVGDTLNFVVDASGHPFYIRVSDGGANVSTPAATNQGAQSGTVSWTPNTAGTYYYQCGNHAGMLGTITVTATTTIDLSAGNMITFNQSANTTVSFANTSTAMSITIIRIKDANTTARTITWPSSVTWNGGSAPTLITNSVSGDSQQFEFITRDGGLTWYAWQPYEFDGPYRDKVMFMIGRNSQGNLGFNDSGAGANNNSRSSPTQLGSDSWTTGPNNWGNGSVECTAAIDMNGKLWSWGHNNIGQLGHNNKTQYSSPVQIGTETTWSSVSMDELHTLALKTDGTLWSIGNSGQGQGGNDNTTPSSSPVQVGTDTTWSKVMTMGNGSYGLKTDGSLWSWGSNDYGHLGQNNNLTYSSPKQIGTQTTWSDISGWYNCVGALKTNGTLWAWGDNTAEGQLGQNNKSSKSSPTQVGTQTTWASIGSGYNSNGIKTDGTLWLWGRNQYGALGDGQAGPWPSYNYAASSPRQVPGTTWEAGTYAGGWSASFVRKTDGTWWGWGQNSYGQLAQNTSGLPGSRSSPVQINGTFSSIQGRGNFFAHYLQDA